MKNVPAVTMDNNLSELVSLVNDSVTTYSRVAPKYKTIIERITDELSSDTQLQNLDIDHMFKLLEISTKNFLAPIETLTKLVQAVTTLKDRMYAETEGGKLSVLLEEIKKEKKKAEKSVMTNIIIDEEKDSEDEPEEIIEIPEDGLPTDEQPEEIIEVEDVDAHAFSQQAERE